MPASVTLKGSPVSVSGQEIKVGDEAPDVTLAKNLKESTKLSEYRGKTVILSVVPSLDTPVCDMQAKRFNEEVTKLGEDVVVLLVSVDLPMAQARWCGATGSDKITCVSDYKHREFGEKYGCYIPELGVLCRAVFVVDPSGKVAYAQYVPEIAEHPDYDAALAAVKN